mmetsp:Transcript_12781/g.28984  ORF Transcript_12781/g.28984 Transcript_12781/m.28984 type:complete len:285 (-) Transcript_12781:28-882(-)
MLWPLAFLRVAAASAFLALDANQLADIELHATELNFEPTTGSRDAVEPVVPPPLPAGDRPVASHISLLRLEEPASVTKPPKRRSLLAPTQRSPPVVPPAEEPANSDAGVQAVTLHAVRHRGAAKRGNPVAVVEEKSPPPAAAAVAPPAAANRTKAKLGPGGQPAGSHTFWKALKTKADSSTNLQRKGEEKRGAKKGHHDHSGLPLPEAPQHSNRRRQLIIIVVVVVLVGLVASCVVGWRLRTRAKGPLAGDAKIQKEFSEHQGPPPHLRVRHWLTGDNKTAQRK